MKFIFMGTPEFAIPTLEKLHELGEVALVVSQRDAKKGRGKKLLPSPVKARALELGLEVYTPENINSEESYQRLQSLEADFFVVAAYGQILKERILALPKEECINVHASLLPRFRGAAPIERSILLGEEKTGITIMRMEKGLDTGDISLQNFTEIADKNCGVLEQELAQMGATLMEQFLRQYEKGEISFQQQDGQLATYAEKIQKEDLLLEIEKEEGEALVRRIKAFAPHYGARISYQGQMLKIYDAAVIPYEGKEEPGTILPEKKRWLVKTVDGAIELLEVQAPGKKKMSASAFLLGNPLPKNTRLGD